MKAGRGQRALRRAQAWRLLDEPARAEREWRAAVKAAEARAPPGLLDWPRFVLGELEAAIERSPRL